MPNPADGFNMRTMNYKKVSGNRIRAARERLGIDRAELAEIIGVEPSAIGNYEQGIRYPKPPLLSKLSKELRVPVGLLSGLEPDKRVEALLSMYSDMDDRGRDTVHSVAVSQSADRKPIEKQENDTGYP